MRLNIITPSCRPYYLPSIAYQLRSYSRLPTRWFVVLDQKSNHPSLDFSGFSSHVDLSKILGVSVELVILPAPQANMKNSLRNVALEQIAENDDELVVFLDDDNLLPADYENSVLQALADHPCACGFIFKQLDHEGNLRMAVFPDHPRSRTTIHTKGCWPDQEGCDTGQMLFRRSFIGNIKWDKEMAADRRFYQAVKEGRELRICWLDVVGSLYNFLRPKSLPV